jgi:hypothetical protein
VIDDLRLEQVLADIGPRLVLDAELATAPAPPPNRRRRPRGRWLLVAAAAAGLTVGGLSPLGGAVADWLGVGSTHVAVRPGADVVPAELPGIEDRAVPISRRQAEARLDRGLVERLSATELGAPDGFATIPEGGVLVVWPDRTTLWVHQAFMDADGWLEKLVAQDHQVHRVDDLGDAGLAVAGDHILETPRRTLRAGATVLWTQGATELRLAGDRPVEELIEIARALDGG